MKQVTSTHTRMSNLVRILLCDLEGLQLLLVLLPFTPPPLLDAAVAVVAFVALFVFVFAAVAVYLPLPACTREVKDRQGRSRDRLTGKHSSSLVKICTMFRCRVGGGTGGLLLRVIR